MKRKLVFAFVLASYLGTFVGGWQASNHFAILSMQEYAELMAARQMLHQLITKPRAGLM